MTNEQPFWERKTLQEMTHDEWESLCDGCGLCCLLKYKDGDEDDIIYTNIGCRLLDDTTCRCSNYANRHVQVPECVQLSPDTIPEWMPDSCAYKLLKHGHPLPDWHPLVSGEADSVHKEGVSVQGKTINEAFISLEDIESQIQDAVVDGLASGDIQLPPFETDEKDN